MSKKNIKTMLDSFTKPKWDDRMFIIIRLISIINELPFTIKQYDPVIDDSKFDNDTLNDIIKFCDEHPDNIDSGISKLLCKYLLELSFEQRISLFIVKDTLDSLYDFDEHYWLDIISTDWLKEQISKKYDIIALSKPIRITVYYSGRVKIQPVTNSKLLREINTIYPESDIMSIGYTVDCLEYEKDKYIKKLFNHIINKSQSDFTKYGQIFKESMDNYQRYITGKTEIIYEQE